MFALRLHLSQSMHLPLRRELLLGRPESLLVLRDARGMAQSNDSGQARETFQMRARMIEQLEFQAEGGGRSQNELALDVLIRHSPEWVSMPELEAVSGSHRMNSRIADLRKRVAKDGQTIENKIQWQDGKCCSFYRLIQISTSTR